MTRFEVYVQGAKACSDGLHEYNDNPYQIGTKERYFWGAGFVQYRAFSQLFRNV